MKPILRVALGLGLEIGRYLAFCPQTFKQLHRLGRRRAWQVRLQKRHSLLHWRLQGESGDALHQPKQVQLGGCFLWQPQSMQWKHWACTWHLLTPWDHWSFEAAWVLTHSFWSYLEKFAISSSALLWCIPRFWQILVLLWRRQFLEDWSSEQVQESFGPGQIHDSAESRAIICSILYTLMGLAAVLFEHSYSVTPNISAHQQTCDMFFFSWSSIGV